MAHTSSVTVGDSVPREVSESGADDGQNGKPFSPDKTGTVPSRDQVSEKITILEQKSRGDGDTLLKATGPKLQNQEIGSPTDAMHYSPIPSCPNEIEDVDALPSDSKAEARGNSDEFELQQRNLEQLSANDAPERHREITARPTPLSAATETNTKPITGTDSATAASFWRLNNGTGSDEKGKMEPSTGSALGKSLHVSNGGGEKTKLVSSDLGQDANQHGVLTETESTHLLLESLPARDVSNLRTYMNLFKTLTGPSTVAVSRVIRNGGLLTGFVGFLFIGFLNAYCNNTMVKCSRILEKRSGKTWYHYEDVVEESCAAYFKQPEWQKAAKYGRRLALWMLILCQLGLLSFYYQIIATTIKKEIELSFTSVSIPLEMMELAVCVCVLPYSWLRNLKFMAWFSSVANIINILCIGTILQYSCTHLKPLAAVDLVPSDPWTFPLFVGGTVFTVEGIAMILPIENRASKPEDYTGTFGIVALATATNVVLNLATGVYGYMAFGNDVSGNVLVSLPNHWIYRLISILYASVVFLTFNLQLYQPAEAIYEWLKKHVRTHFMLTYGNIVVRTAIVILTYLFAAVVPQLDLMMSLVGAFTAAFLVFILPIVCELMLLHSQPGGIGKFTWAKNIFILVFGLVAFVMGTFTSISDIITALRR